MADKRLQIRTSKLSEVFDLAPRLREDDKRECLAAGSTPLEALKAGVRQSYIKRSVYTKDNVLIGILGANTKGMPDGYAAVWFLGSNESENYPISFIKEGKKFINEVLNEYSIYNLVFSENKSHIEYLKRIGLHVMEDNPIQSVNGIFYPFYKMREEVSVCAIPQ